MLIVIKRSILFLIPVLLILSSFSCRQSTELKDVKPEVIVATFNGNKITQIEFEEQFNIPEAAGTDYNLYSLKLELLNLLINEKIILLEAKEMKIKISNEVLNEEFNYRIHKSFQPDLESKTKLLKTLKTQLIIKEFMKRKFSNINFTKKELRKYYDQNSNRFYEPDEVSVMQMFLIDENLASEVYAQLKKGNKFETLAKKFNEPPYKENAGDIQTYRKGELPPEFEVIVFKLRKGKFSKVIKSNYGYHIFKLKSKKMARVIEFKEVKNMIKDKLTEQAIEKKFKVWISKERSKFDIKINYKYLEK